MIREEPALSVRVECYAGYRGEESPRRFFLKSREIVVEEIVDRWLVPDHRSFKVRTDEGDISIIRHDVTLDRWELTLFTIHR